jgi:D-amino-acid dehydrogenase
MRTYDAVVVGAGIVGSHTAYELVRRGLSILLVDASHKGTATSAGAGIVQSLGQSEKEDAVQAVLFEAAAGYLRLGECLAEEGLADWGHSQPGAMLLAGDDEARATLTGLVSSWQARGFFDEPGAGVPELIEPAEVTARCPVLAPVRLAVWMPKAARIDGRTVRAALQSAFEARGGDVVRGEARLEGRTCHVGDEAFGAASIVVAAGAWTSQLLTVAAPRVVPVFPRRGEILHLNIEIAPGRPPSHEWPTVTTLASPHYLVGFPGGRAVVGGTAAEVGFDPRVTAGGLSELVDAALRMAPALREASFLEARVGLRPVSTDGLPVVGAVPAAPGLFVATGLGHGGLHMAPAIGSRLADLVTGSSGRPASRHVVDWAAFDPARPAPQLSSSAG